MVSGALVLAAIFCAEPSVSEQPKPVSAQNDWELFVALSGGVQPDVHAGVGTGRIGVNRAGSRSGARSPRCRRIGPIDRGR